MGESVLININADGKNYQMEVEVLKKEKLGREKLKTIVVKPILKQVKLEGVLEKKGDGIHHIAYETDNVKMGNTM